MELFGVFAEAEAHINIGCNPETSSKIIILFYFCILDASAFSGTTEEQKLRVHL